MAIGDINWLNDFIKSLQQSNQVASTAGLPQLQQVATPDINAYQSEVGDYLNPQPTQQAASIPTITPEIAARLAGDEQNYAQSPGIASRVLDILSRPLYATSNVATATAQNIRALAGDENVETSNPFSALGRGLTGEEKGTYIDTFEAAGVPGTTAALLGTVANIGLDPVNKLVGPVGGAALRGIKGATSVGRASRAIEAGDNLLDAERAANAADELANQQSIITGGTKSAALNNPRNLGEALLTDRFPETPTGANIVPNADEVARWPVPTDPARAALAIPDQANLASRLSSILKVNSKGIVEVPKPSSTAGVLSSGIKLQKIDDAIADLGARAYPGIRHIPTPYEGMRTAAREIRTPAAQEAFVEKYRSLLNPEDFAALQKVRYPKQWQSTVDNIINRLEPGRISSVDDFVAAAKNGELPKAEVDKVLKTAGVKRVEQLPGEYSRLRDVARPRAEEPENAAPRPDEDAWGGTQPGVEVQELTESGRVKPKGQAAKDKMDAAARLDALTKSADDLLDEIDNHQIKSAIENGDMIDQANVVDQILSETDNRPRIPGRAQADRSQRLINETAKATRAQSLRGSNQAQTIKDAVYNELKRVEASEAERGVIHNISSGEPGGASAWPMTTTQIWDLLGDGLVRQGAIDFQNFIPPSSINAMVARVLDRTGELIEPEALAQDLIKVGKKHAGPYGTPKRSQEKFGRTVDKINDSYDLIAHHLANSRDEIQAIAEMNLAAHHDAIVVAGKRAADAVEAKIDHDFKTSEAEAIKDIAEPKKLVNDAVKGNEEAALPAATQVGKYISKVTNQRDVAAARRALGNTRILERMPPKQARELIKSRSMGEAKAAWAETRDILSDRLGIDPDRYPDIDMVDVETQFARRYNTIGSMIRPFGADSGELATIYQNNFSAYMSIMVPYEEGLIKIFKGFSKEDQKQVFTAIQARSTVDERLAPLMEQLKPYVDKVFAVDGDPLFGAFFREGYSPVDINSVLKEQGITKQVFKTKIPKDIDANDFKAVQTYVADSWRDMAVDDPIAFLTRIHAAQMNLHMRGAIGADFGARFGTTFIPKGAKSAGVKYVRLPDSTTFDTKIMQHVPRKTPDGKTIYYQKEAVDYLVNLEKTLSRPTSFSGSKNPFAKFVTNVVDPVLAAWKPLVTIIRPGHHIRNGFGDMMLNYSVGVRGITPYKKALVIMRAGGKTTKEANAAIDELLKQPEALTGGAARSANKYDTVTVKLANGHTVTYNAADVWKMALQDGILPRYHLSEDILKEHGGETRGIQGLVNRIQRSKPVQLGGLIAEQSSWEFRIAQYVDHLEKGYFIKDGKKVTFKNERDARLKVSDRVRKTHPDTSGLSPIDRKVMRRIFPFYSWIRQIIPLVGETLLTKPARLTAIQKVYWGINQAFNPDAADSNSLTDPFPVTRLIPSFLRDSLGYVGGSYVFNLGSPTESMADMLNGNPQRNVLAMLNPLIKAPIELGSETNLGTGAHISDKSEYFDQLLPGVSQVASISGISPSGTVSNWLTGQSTQGWPAGIDPQRAVAKNEKDLFFNQSLFNFLSGMSLQNFNRQSYENIAARELGRGGGT